MFERQGTAEPPHGGLSHGHEGRLTGHGLGPPSDQPEPRRLGPLALGQSLNQRQDAAAPQPLGDIQERRIRPFRRQRRVQVPEVNNAAPAGPVPITLTDRFDELTDVSRPVRVYLKPRSVLAGKGVTRHDEVTRVPPSSSTAASASPTPERSLKMSQEPGEAVAGCPCRRVPGCQRSS